MINDYFVGGVADFISSKKKFKLKPKTEQPRSNSKELSHVQDKKCSIQKNMKSLISNLKFKNQNKSRDALKYSEQFVESNFSGTKVNNHIPTKRSLENITESTVKRKKLFEECFSNATDEEKVLIHKEAKLDLLALDHTPSDSEEDEAEKVQKISEYKYKTLSKEFAKNDYKENTIFVGNIPINYDKQKICKVFSKFGEIQSVRIRCVPVPEINVSKKVAAIKKRFNPKRNSIVAYVKFKSQESVQAALKANGMIIDGHHLRVDSVEENKDLDNNKAVFVGGLPFDIEDDELWEFFQSCGQINSVRIIRDSQTSMGKGFGYINFDSTASVELALQLDGQELKKRKINVKRCIKARNKNKLNSFSRKKSKEMSNQLLCKKSKKFKEERKKLKKEKNSFSNDFQGKKANIKQKKKKKLSKAALYQKKLIKILNSS